MTVADKAALRAKARALRQTEAPNHPYAARAAARHGLDAIPVSSGAMIAGYAAIGDELDALPWLAGLAARQAGTALPCIVAPGRPLVFRAWRPMDALIKTRFGTREPPTSAPEVQPSVLIVPMLAYDARGYRLGYGGGYYDRTLEALQDASVRTIGLAYAFQKVALLPRERHDEPLDAVVTELGVEWFPRTLEHL